MTSLPGWFDYGFDASLKFYSRVETSCKTPEELRLARRELAQNDLFYLLIDVCKRGDMVHPWLFDRCREVQQNPDGFLDVWAREHYKAVDVEEPVPTPVGWKRHGDLAVGDWVYGSDGVPTRVVAKTEVFTNADCYRVTFDDGYSVVVSGQHLWTVEKRTRLRKYRGKQDRAEVVMNTKEIFKHSHRPDNRLSIPVAPPLLNVEHVLPIAPYTLGCWLGDGANANGTVTCGDDIWTGIIDSGHEISAGRPSRDITRTVYGIQPELRSMGLLNNKHIPQEYLWACERQRMELLRGLMDTDGSCNDRGTATFINKCKPLAEDVAVLCSSLGLKPRWRVISTHHGEVYSISFQAYKSAAPFKLPRKIARCKGGSPRSRRFITSVECVDTRPVSCIQVEATNGLYLIGKQMVTTHNSTIITFGLTLLNILNNPEITVGIFSHTRGGAKKFLRQLKEEMENNKDLVDLFPEILWEKPKSQAPKWGEETGLIVKRQGNPKEATVEAWGLVDGMPTGSHFFLRIYDDVVTPASVSTPDQIKKTTDAWALSDNLGMEGGIVRTIGTYYHHFDTYREMEERGAVVVRKHPCCQYSEDARGEKTPDFSTAVLKAPATLRKKYRDQGVYIFGCQMMLNPTADKSQGFRLDWLKRWEPRTHKNLFVFGLFDPSSGKNKKNQDGKDRDYSAGWVIGYAADEKFRVLDMLRDKLTLTERQKALEELHRFWEMEFWAYEEEGMQSDIAHFEACMEQNLYDMDIIPVKSRGLSKNDRIKRLVPLFEAGKIILPNRLVKADWEGKSVNLVTSFIKEEYEPFPVLKHDDMLDALSQVENEEVKKRLRLPNRGKTREGVITAIRKEQRRGRPVV